MRRSILLASAIFALGLLADPPALAGGPSAPSGSQFKPSTKTQDDFEEKELTPARKVEKLPGSISLKLGQKVSYAKVGPCALMDPSMARMALNEKKILTLVGRKLGTTKLFVFNSGGGGMREIPLKVTR